MSGIIVSFKAGAANTAAATLNLDGLGAKAIRKSGDIALDGGEIVSGGRYLAIYDAAYNAAAGAWVLINQDLRTLTDNLTISRANPSLILDTANANQEADIYFRRNGLSRFVLGKTSQAESGGNAGSNFFLNSYNDAGAFLKSILGVDRASGLIDVYQGQVRFPATQNPSSDPNALDDYEEGTFTPTFSATGCTFSYATQSGSYTKIGNRVFFNLTISLNTSGNTLAANIVNIVGLPFANADPSTQRFRVHWSNTGSNYIDVGVALPVASSSLQIIGATAAAASNIGSLVASNVLSATLGTLLSITGHYQA